MVTLPAGAETLADVLLQEKLINEDQYAHAKREYETSGRSYGSILVSIGAVSENVKLGVLTKKCKCELVGLKDVTLAPMAADRVPRELCVQHTAVPYKVEGQSLYVAMEDPTDARAVSQIAAAADLELVLQCAKSSEIKALIEQIPKKVTPAAQKKRYFKKLLGLITLPIIVGLPPLLLIGLILYNRDFQKFYRELQYDQFELVLIFVLAWSSWAIVGYWINGLIFGEPEEEE